MVESQNGQDSNKKLAIVLAVGAVGAMVMVGLVLLVIIIYLLLPTSRVATHEEDEARRVRDSHFIMKARAELGVIETNLNLYKLDNGQYPSTEEGLDVLQMETIHEDPWGESYRYEFLGTEGFKVWSLGPDGEDGTEDDVRLE